MNLNVRINNDDLPLAREIQESAKRMSSGAVLGYTKKVHQLYLNGNAISAMLTYPPFPSERAKCIRLLLVMLKKCSRHPKDF